MNEHRILIVESHTLMRQGLKAMLAAEAGLLVAGEARNGQQAAQLVGTLSPCLVLMDLTMPDTDGIEFILGIKKCCPEIKVLVLSAHKEEESIRAALVAGADGYMLKQASRDELMLALRSILDGKAYLSPDVTQEIVHGYLDGGIDRQANTAWNSLTAREREVLTLIAAGNANRHIASQLEVSIKTVEKHRANLMRKLDLHNAAALTAFALARAAL